MKQAILLLPLLVLALVAPAAAEETPLEKQLGKQIEEVEAHLQAAALALRSAKDPEEQKKLTQEIQAHHQHLATLHARRETLRLQQALAERLDFVRADLKVDEVSPATAVALLAGPLEIDAIVDSKADAKPITLDLKYVTLREAFETIAKTAGLEMRLDGKVVRLEKPKPKKAVLPPKWGFAWNKPHLEDLRRRLQEEKHPAKRAAIQDEIRIRKVIEKYETSSIPQKDYSVIRVTMRFADTPLSDAATRLARAHGVEILVPERFGERRISVDLKDRTLPAAVGGIALAAGGIASTSGKGLYVLWPVAAPHHVKSIPKAPTPEEKWKALRDEIRALRAEIAEIKAILLRSR